MSEDITEHNTVLEWDGVPLDLPKAVGVMACRCGEWHSAAPLSLARTLQERNRKLLDRTASNPQDETGVIIALAVSTSMKDFVVSEI